MTEKIAAVTETANKPRLMSLDALRGFDMFWILGGEALFAALLLLTTWGGWRWFDGQMHHSSWHGFTFYDLIFRCLSSSPALPWVCLPSVWTSWRLPSDSQNISTQLSVWLYCCFLACSTTTAGGRVCRRPWMRYAMPASWGVSPSPGFLPPCWCGTQAQNPDLCCSRYLAGIRHGAAVAAGPGWQCRGLQRRRFHQRLGRQSFPARDQLPT